MKTLKIVALLFLILSLATFTVSSQNKPVTIVAPLIVTNELYFDCLDQYLVGTLTATRTFMNNHMVAKISGTLTGSIDQLDYSVELFNSKDIEGLVNWDDWGQKAIAYTWASNLHVLRGGKLIGVMGYAYHYIVNANGEETASHGDVYKVSCVGGM
jgi:hypothetical protein